MVNRSGTSDAFFQENLTKTSDLCHLMLYTGITNIISNLFMRKYVSANVSSLYTAECVSFLELTGKEIK